MTDVQVISTRRITERLIEKHDAEVEERDRPSLWYRWWQALTRRTAA